MTEDKRAKWSMSHEAQRLLYERDDARAETHRLARERDEWKRAAETVESAANAWTADATHQEQELAAARTRILELEGALLTVEGLICDEPLCGHVTADDIRAVVTDVLARGQP